MHPDWRAAPVAAAAKDATPQAEAAFPRRSRFFVITGAAGGVLTVATIAFSLRARSDFFGSLCARTLRLLLVPVDPLPHRVDADERQRARPDHSGARRASSATYSRFSFSSCWALP